MSEFRQPRVFPIPDPNLPESGAFINDDSSTLDADGFRGIEGCTNGPNLFKTYMRYKIVDANMRLNHCGYQLSVLEQLARHKMQYVRQLEEVAEKLDDTPRYVAQVQSLLGKQMVRIKLGSESFVVPLTTRLPDADQVKAGSKVGVRFTRSGKMEIYQVFPGVQDPLVTLMLVQKDTDSSYEVIGGLEQQIQEIREVVELPILHPELFDALGISQPKGVLLYGPPGTGKTLLARAVAHHTKCAFFKLSGTELVQKYIGEGARLMRELFVMAREKAPSIIFLDEVDSIGTKRSDSGGSDSSSCERTMIELLNQVDGFEPAENIKVILATNRIDTLDSALIRPGRVDRKIFFPPPNLQGRVDILRIHSRKMNLGRTVCLRTVAERMQGASGAELRLVCQEAAFSALREGRQFVNQEDFLQKIEKVMKNLAAKSDQGHIK